MSVSDTLYKEELKKKLEEAESSVAKGRLFVILSNFVNFLFFMSHDYDLVWLAWTIQAVAVPYGFAVLFLKPYKRFPLLASSVLSTLMDTSLIGLWLLASGGGNSPFFILWYVSIIAVAMRFSTKETMVIAFAYLFTDMAVVFTDSDAKLTTVEMVARFSYIIGLGYLGTFIANSVESQIFDKLQLFKAREELAATNESLEKTVESRTAALRETTQDLIDSVKYSKRIQIALTPTDQEFRNAFSEHFIFYKPKDIIGGDFYWIHQEGDKKLVAAVDCTGHGVPGAMLAVMGINLMERIVVGQKIMDPAKILTQIDDYLKYTFSKYETNVELNDGMVASICLVNSKTKMIRYAGAEQAMLYAKNNEVVEFKADRLSLGKTTRGNEKIFTELEFEIEKGDAMYLYSDGFVDQFGGPKDKKFLKHRLKSLIQENCARPMTVQGNIFRKTFKDWKGDNPQVDDVTLIGFRI